MLAPNTYLYRVTFVDANGNESAASDTTRPITLAATGGVVLNDLPSAAGTVAFVSRRLYRATLTTDVNGNQVISDFLFAGQFNASAQSFLDSGQVTGAILNAPEAKLRQRLDARLAIDPGLVVKSAGSFIELGIGTQLIAEGSAGNAIVMTSLDDRRFGAGGTFNTNKAGTDQGSSAAIGAEFTSDQTHRRAWTMSASSVLVVRAASKDN